MNTIKETATARLVLETNAKNEMLFLLKGSDFDYTDRVTKETEKAICYRGSGTRLNGDSGFGLNMWIPKSIMKREVRELNGDKGIRNIECIVVPAWFYNKFLHESNLTDFK